MNKRVISIITIAALASATALTVYADPMNWFPDKPQTRITETCSMSPDGLRCWIFTSAWHDGAAEVRVVPMTYDWPEDGLPRSGVMTLAKADLDRVTTYPMALRYDNDGNPYLFGSLPVGTLDLGLDTEYTMEAYAADGTLLAKDYHSWGDVPVPEGWEAGEWNTD